MTNNQTTILNCIDTEDTKFKIICIRYASIQSEKGYNSNYQVWKTTVSRILDSLIKYKEVEYISRGVYRRTN